MFKQLLNIYPFKKSFAHLLICKCAHLPSPFKNHLHIYSFAHAHIYFIRTFISFFNNFAVDAALLNMLMFKVVFLIDKD